MPTTTAFSTGQIDAGQSPEALRYLDEIQRQLAAYKAGRSAGAIAHNIGTGARYKAACFEAFNALANDCPRHNQVTDALEYMQTHGAAHFGLPELPCERVVRKYRNLFFNC